VTLTADEVERLLAAADLVCLARTGVEYDYRGNVIDAHAPEMPTRFAKQLTQLVRGGIALGISRDRAMRLAIRCARDSMPPLRLEILLDVAANPGTTRTQDIRQRLGKPRATVDRQLQSLQMLGVLHCDEDEDAQERTVRCYRPVAGIDLTVLDPRAVPDLSPHGDKGTKNGAFPERRTPRPPTDKSGTASTAPTNRSTAERAGATGNDDGSAPPGTSLSHSGCIECPPQAIPSLLLAGDDGIRRCRRHHFKGWAS
jgi:hypothetical protein